MRNAALGRDQETGGAPGPRRDGTGCRARPWTRSQAPCCGSGPPGRAAPRAAATGPRPREPVPASGDDLPGRGPTLRAPPPTGARRLGHLPTRVRRRALLAGPAPPPLTHSGTGFGTARGRSPGLVKAPPGPGRFPRHPPCIPKHPRSCRFVWLRHFRRRGCFARCNVYVRWRYLSCVARGADTSALVSPNWQQRACNVSCRRIFFSFSSVFSLKTAYYSRPPLPCYRRKYTFRADWLFHALMATYYCRWPRKI